MAAGNQTRAILRNAIFLIVFAFSIRGSLAETPSFWQSNAGELVSPGEATNAAEREAAAATERQAVLDLALIQAVANRDAMAVRKALTEGANPDAAVPSPAPDELAEPHLQSTLYYYLKREQNFTALMFASALGDRAIVDLLLDAGADPIAKTARNRTLPIQLAAKSGDTYIQQRLLGIDDAHPARQMSVEVDLSSQTIYVHQGGDLLITAPISSGRASHPTPTGTFVVTDRWRSWTSTIYNVKMPYFLRLSCSPFGLHAGRLPGYPASHGCIRLPHKEAKEIFQRVPIGTLVTIR